MVSEHLRMGGGTTTAFLPACLPTPAPAIKGCALFRCLFLCFYFFNDKMIRQLPPPPLMIRGRAKHCQRRHTHAARRGGGATPATPTTTAHYLTKAASGQVGGRLPPAPTCHAMLRLGAEGDPWRRARRRVATDQWRQLDGWHAHTTLPAARGCG